MPLLRGSSDHIIRANFSELRSSGYPEKQAWAIAMKKARKNKRPSVRKPRIKKTGMMRDR